VRTGRAATSSVNVPSGLAQLCTVSVVASVTWMRRPALRAAAVAAALVGRAKGSAAGRGAGAALATGATVSPAANTEPAASSDARRRDIIGVPPFVLLAEVGHSTEMRDPRQ
jgi:hypothetical protein